jgi:hypothetical protein
LGTPIGDQSCPIENNPPLLLFQVEKVVMRTPPKKSLRRS